jgi:hypothetical protein
VTTRTHTHANFFFAWQPLFAKEVNAEVKGSLGGAQQVDVE